MCYSISHQVVILGDMAPIGLLLAAIGTLKFGFGHCFAA